MVDYFAALAMARCEGRGRRLHLLASLTVNLGLLFFFKYYNFFRGAFETLFGSLGVDASMPVSPYLLPIGISFYTFQTLGYTIDVYRGRKAPERHFGIFAVYVAFFPQLVTVPRWGLNLVIVFVVSGLWHGANWTFLAWGGLHALYMLLSYALSPLRERLGTATGIAQAPRMLGTLQIITTFTLVCFSWILFRAESISEAVYIIGHLFTGWGVLFRFNDLTSELFSLGLARQEFLIAIAGIAVLEGSHLLQRRGTVREQLAKLPIGIRWTAYSTALWAILILGVFGNKEFIYFTF